MVRLSAQSQDSQELRVRNQAGEQGPKTRQEQDWSKAEHENGEAQEHSHLQDKH